ncbi:MAG: alpha/beta hydrolase-fold protein [Anaeromyxobacter sp.]
MHRSPTAAALLACALALPLPSRADDAPGRPVRLEVRAPGAKDVQLLPAEGPAQPMKRGDDWRFWVVVRLQPGRFAYAFQVDGERRLDPTSDAEERGPDGARRSVVVVRDGRNARPDPAVPHGQVLREKRRSAARGETVPFAVWLPPGFQPGQELPLLVMLHGMNMGPSQWLDGGLANYLDNLLAQGRIRPMVVLFPDGGGESFYEGEVEQDIVAELVPAIRKRFGLRAGPAAIAGMSMGGYGALHLAQAHPDVFGHADALSPGSMDQGSLPRLDAALAKAPYPVPLTIRCGKSDDLVLPWVERAVRILRNHGTEFTYVTARGAHDWEYWRSVTEPVLEEASRFLEGAAPVKEVKSAR